MATFYKNIIVALDFSEFSLQCFDKAVSLAKEQDATLHLVSVVNTYSNAAVEAFDRSYAEKVFTEYEQKQAELAVQATAAGVKKIVQVVKYGSPKKVLIEYENADLIIIGATGLNAMERFILGSVSTNVLRYAKCDVLLIK